MGGDEAIKLKNKQLEVLCVNYRLEIMHSKKTEWIGREVGKF